MGTRHKYALPVFIGFSNVPDRVQVLQFDIPSFTRLLRASAGLHLYREFRWCGQHLTPLRRAGKRCANRVGDVVEECRLGPGWRGATVTVRATKSCRVHAMGQVSTVNRFLF